MGRKFLPSSCDGHNPFSRIFLGFSPERTPTYRSILYSYSPAGNHTNGGPITNKSPPTTNHGPFRVLSGMPQVITNSYVCYLYTFPLFRITRIRVSPLRTSSSLHVDHVREYISYSLYGEFLIRSPIPSSTSFSAVLCIRTFRQIIRYPYDYDIPAHLTTSSSQALKQLDHFLPRKGVVEGRYKKILYTKFWILWKIFLRWNNSRNQKWHCWTLLICIKFRH